MLNQPPVGLLPEISNPYIGLEQPVTYVSKNGGITIAEVWGITDKGTVTFSLKHRVRATIFQLDSGTAILNSNLLAITAGQATTSFNDATVPAGNVIVLRIEAITGTPQKFYHTIVAS